MFRSVIPFFFYMFTFVNESQCQCQTVNSTTGLRTPCAFPFTLRGRNVETTFNFCTTTLDPNNRAWCSTKTVNGIHQTGFWGHCDLASSTNCLPERDTKVINRVNQMIDDRGGTDSVKATCPCKKAKECPWISVLLDDLSSIPRGTEARNKAVSLLRSLVCNNSEQKIHCCSLSSTRTNRLRGDWRPDPEKGECGLRLTAENIVGGEIAKRGEYPYMVLLGYLIEDRVFYLCGGSVINAKYVLTAAHCHSSDRPIREVVVGEHVVGTDPDCDGAGFCQPPIQQLKVDQVKLHENWSRKTFRAGYDIALIRVRGHIVMAFDDGKESAVAPVCLPWTRKNYANVGDRPTVTGWGRVTNDQEESNNNYRRFSVASRTLQSARLPIISATQCRRTYTQLNEEIQICAGTERGVDSCGGDSGGPLVKRDKPDSPWFQVGIVSFGPRVCGLGRPGVYSKVEHFLPWIQDNIEP